LAFAWQHRKRFDVTIAGNRKDEFTTGSRNQCSAAQREYVRFFIIAALDTRLAFQPLEGKPLVLLSLSHR
jgi:hypothetical protein